MWAKAKVELDPAFTAAAKRDPAMVMQEMRVGVGKGARVVRAAQRQTAPRLTGNLAGHIVIRTSRKYLSASIGPTVSHALIRDRGTEVMRGGRIQAKAHNWLTFRVGDRWVKVRSVKQTGAHYLKRALDLVTGQLQAIIDDVSRRVAAKLFGGQ